MRHPDDMPFEYSKITDYIYIGTNKCCKGKFVKGLLKKGIRADISLERKKAPGSYQSHPKESLKEF